MTGDEKAKISLELLYNAICYFHGDAKEIVQKLLHMDQMTLNQFADSYSYDEAASQKDAPGCIGCMSALRQSVFASGDVEDILFYRIANNLPIE